MTEAKKVTETGMYSMGIALVVRDYIAKTFCTQKSIYRALGMEHKAWIRSINGYRAWTMDEIERLSDRLGISVEEIIDRARAKAEQIESEAET